MHKTREALRGAMLLIFLKTPKGNVFFEFRDTGHKIGLTDWLTKRAAFFQAVALERLITSNGQPCNQR